jgi:organic hydroperoxide reductase OsmC/OhrA
MSTNSKIFTVLSQSSWGIQTPINGSALDKSFLPIEMSIPPEFAGPGIGYSPEDLYALALLNCYIATFKYVAEKSKLPFTEISGEAILEVGDTDSQKNWMKSVAIKIVLKGTDQPDRALNLLHKTTSHCMIHQSVKTEINFDFRIE